MKLDRSHLFLLVLACGIGYYMASSASAAPAPNRPVARFFARVAKNLLWVALAAEPTPTGPQPDHRIVHAEIGADGYPRLDNARGW
jgi:hypothetical protein